MNSRLNEKHQVARALCAPREVPSGVELPFVVRGGGGGWGPSFRFYTLLDSTANDSSYGKYRKHWILDFWAPTR